MPVREQGGNPRSAEEDAQRVRRDHDAISGLADDLLPALIAKLAASGLGEIEIRQGGWKARLRMPASAPEARGAGKAADAHAAASHPAAHSAVRGAAVHARPDDDLPGESARVSAKSPAVGVYNPRKDLAVGMRVRSGDKIGTVNVLGVNEDVLSPVDGIIGSSLAEAGEAVEYGQELVRIELPEPAADKLADGPKPEPVGAAGKS